MKILPLAAADMLPCMYAPLKVDGHEIKGIVDPYADKSYPSDLLQRPPPAGGAPRIFDSSHAIPPKAERFAPHGQSALVQRAGKAYALPFNQCLLKEKAAARGADGCGENACLILCFFDFLRNKRNGQARSACL